jgi:hypothetical protein
MLQHVGYIITTGPSTVNDAHVICHLHLYPAIRNNAEIDRMLLRIRNINWQMLSRVCCKVLSVCPSVCL